MNSRHKQKPLLVTLVQIGLLINLVSAAFIFLGLLGNAIYQGYKNDFSKQAILIPVAIRDFSADSVALKGETPLVFHTSNAGDAEVQLPFLASLLVPTPFIKVWEVSVINLFFYLVVYFSLYRILVTITRDGPFSENNKSRLYWLGGLFIAWGIALIVRDAWLNSAIQTISEKQLAYDGHGITNYIETGLVVFIIALVYNRIIVLEKEASLVI